LGGTEDVFSGAATDISQVYGSELVSSGGSIYAETVHSGGALTVSSGGSVFDGLTISGGYAGI
jgi:autotransporter passenger strand-loop-strand repeat protein